MAELGDLFKKLYQEIPWPHAYEINGQRWEQLKAEIPPAKQPLTPSWMWGGLRICVDESVPPDEVHAISVVRDPETGEYKKQVSKIINIGSASQPPATEGAK